MKAVFSLTNWYTVVADPRGKFIGAVLASRWTVRNVLRCRLTVAIEIPVVCNKSIFIDYTSQFLPFGVIENTV